LPANVCLLQYLKTNRNRIESLKVAGNEKNGGREGNIKKILKNCFSSSLLVMSGSLWFNKKKKKRRKQILGHGLGPSDRGLFAVKKCSF
jgi:hypothetical protein